jgi:hypothetical protein
MVRTEAKNFSKDELFMIFNRGRGAMMRGYEVVKPLTDKIYEVIQEFKVEAEANLNQSTETEI